MEEVTDVKDGPLNSKSGLVVCAAVDTIYFKLYYFQITTKDALAKIPNPAEYMSLIQGRSRIEEFLNKEVPSEEIQSRLKETWKGDNPLLNIYKRRLEHSIELCYETGLAQCGDMDHAVVKAAGSSASKT